MSDAASPNRLTFPPDVSSEIRAALARDYERFAREGLPASLESYLAEEYDLDVATTYAGLPVKNPWGKASGQLSMTARQVEEDVAAGLGFVVLKTVIAEDASGERTMQAWAIREARMVVEPITGRSGESGWTVSWKGRGWWLSFDDYLQLIRDARRLAAGTGTLIVPSCKYHLPMPDEEGWRTSEYEYTTQRILAAYDLDGSEPVAGMPLEKDFSPTLAGSDRAAAQSNILEWLDEVPRLIRTAIPPQSSAASSSETASRSPARVGLKLFNALFDDEFQLEMLRAIHRRGSDRADFYVHANRLFDPQREFEGMRGIAYGGPDLSDRNLRVMDAFRQEVAEGRVQQPLLEWSATGNITTGRMALEYALRGASSFQLHTFFQLPSDAYRLQKGNKTQKALHELYFHPETGFVAWMHCLADRLGLPRNPIRFRDVIGRAADVVGT